MKRAIAAASLLASTACFHQHSPRNAPGTIAVREPPRPLESREVETPLDPGENMFVLSYGAFAGGGIATGGDEDGSRAAYGIGPELSAQIGSSDRSHADDDFWILPTRSLGLNLGATLLTGEGDRLGPLYAELQVRELPLAFAAGWAWDQDDTEHGPQGTISLGPFYVRTTHLLDGATQVHGGLVLKGWSAWVWSR